MCCGLKKGYWGSKIAWILVVIGALNWGLVGIFEWNLVSAIFGGVAWLERLIYILVGIAGLGTLIGCPWKECKKQSDMKGSSCGSGVGMDKGK